jgi:N-methylhydantoinase A
VVDELYAASVASAFHDAHRALYGYDFRDDPAQQVEWVNLRVTGIGPITRPVLRELPCPRKSSEDPAGPGPTDPPKTRGTRAVCFDADEGYRGTPVHWRADLCAGDTFEGPAIVEEFGSTVPVHPGFTVRVDSIGNLVITRGGAR